MLSHLKALGQRFTVEFTSHTRACRPTEPHPRNCIVYPKLAYTLLYNAMLRGLTSFRGRETVITARVGDESAISFLVMLQEDNKLIVLSILNHTLTNWYPYQLCRNRINLWHIIFPRLSLTQVRDRRSERATPKGKHVRLTKSKVQPIKAKLEHPSDYTTTHNYKRQL